LFEIDGKEIFSNSNKQTNVTAREMMDEESGIGQLVRWKAWCRQNNIKCAVSEEYASC